MTTLVRDAQHTWANARNECVGAEGKRDGKRRVYKRMNIDMYSRTSDRAHNADARIRSGMQRCVRHDKCVKEPNKRAARCGGASGE